MCFIVFVSLCVVHCFECCVLFFVMYVIVLCVIVVPLSPGTNPLAVINNIYIYIYISSESKLAAGHTQPPCQWASEGQKGASPRIKRPGSGTGNSTPLR